MQRFPVIGNPCKGRALRIRRSRRKPARWRFSTVTVTVEPPRVMRESLTITVHVTPRGKAVQ